MLEYYKKWAAVAMAACLAISNVSAHTPPTRTHAPTSILFGGQALAVTALPYSPKIHLKRSHIPSLFQVIPAGWYSESFTHTHFADVAGSVPTARSGNQNDLSARWPAQRLEVAMRDGALQKSVRLALASVNVAIHQLQDRTPLPIKIIGVLLAEVLLLWMFVPHKPISLALALSLIMGTLRQETDARPNGSDAWDLPRIVKNLWIEDTPPNKRNRTSLASFLRSYFDGKILGPSQKALFDDQGRLADSTLVEVAYRRQSGPAGEKSEQPFEPMTDSPVNDEISNIRLRRTTVTSDPELVAPEPEAPNGHHVPAAEPYGSPDETQCFAALKTLPEKDLGEFLVTLGFSSSMALQWRAAIMESMSLGELPGSVEQRFGPDHTGQRARDITRILEQAARFVTPETAPAANVQQMDVPQTAVPASSSQDLTPSDDADRLQTSRHGPVEIYHGIRQLGLDGSITHYWGKLEEVVEDFGRRSHLERWMAVEELLSFAAQDEPSLLATVVRAALPTAALVLPLPSGPGRRAFDQRDHLEPEDLSTLMRDITDPATAPDEREWSILALQRRWPTLSEDFRDHLAILADAAFQQGTLTSDQHTGVLRPLMTSVGTMSADSQSGEDVAWETASLAVKTARIRKAVNRLQDEAGIPLIPAAWVAQELHIAPKPLVLFLQGDLHRDPIYFSILDGTGPKQITAARYVLQQNPDETIPGEALAALLDHAPRLADAHLTAQGARPTSGSTGPVPTPDSRTLAGEMPEDPREEPSSLSWPGPEALEANAPASFHYRWQPEVGCLLPVREEEALPLDVEQRPIVRAWVQHALQEMSRTLDKPVEALDKEDYRKFRYRKGGRTYSMGKFFAEMDALNDTGLPTPYFMNRRFDVVSYQRSLRDVATLGELKTILIAALARELHWDHLNQEMKKELVRELSRQLKKPVEWLVRDDYVTVPLDIFADIPHLRDKTLVQAYRAFAFERGQYFKDHPEKPIQTVPIFIRWRLGLYDPKTPFVHPAELLRSKKELSHVLRQGWVKYIPWEYMPVIVARELILDLAGKRDLGDLRVEDFDRPYPDLAIYDPRTGLTKEVSLKGLYVFFQRDPDCPSRQVIPYMLDQLDLRAMISSPPHQRQTPPPNAKNIAKVSAARDARLKKSQQADSDLLTRIDHLSREDRYAFWPTSMITAKSLAGIKLESRRRRLEGLVTSGKLQHAWRNGMWQYRIPVQNALSQHHGLAVNWNEHTAEELVHDEKFLTDFPWPPAAVHEVLAIYRVIQTTPGPQTARNALTQTASLGFLWIKTEDDVHRAMEFLDEKAWGFHRIGHTYEITGAGCETFINCNIPDWKEVETSFPESAELSMDEIIRRLEDPASAETPLIVVRTIAQLLEANGLAMSDLSSGTQQSINSLRRRESRPMRAQDLGASFYRLSRDLGVDPVFLRTRRTRTQIVRALKDRKGWAPHRRFLAHQRAMFPLSILAGLANVDQRMLSNFERNGGILRITDEARRRLAELLDLEPSDIPISADAASEGITPADDAEGNVQSPQTLADLRNLTEVAREPFLRQGAEADPTELGPGARSAVLSRLQDCLTNFTGADWPDFIEAVRRQFNSTIERATRIVDGIREALESAPGGPFQTLPHRAA